MPELLLRMQIGNDYTLTQMQDIFNQIMINISKRRGPLQPGASALMHFPEVFQKPRVDYIYAMLRKIAGEVHVPGDNPD